MCFMSLRVAILLTYTTLLFLENLILLFFFLKKIKRKYEASTIRAIFLNLL